MKIGIIQFPGSNCERETIQAVERADMQAIPFLWNESKELLQEMDGYVIVGGFSYEDRSRAGIIAALQPIILELTNQSEKGKPILGICNGAQILVEAGLVPGLSNHKTGMALTTNKRIAQGKVLGTGFYNNWVHMRLSDDYQRNAFTHFLNEQTILSVPIAHAEGRLVMTDALWQEIKMQGLAIFQYCDATGNIVDEFPVNPNGSLQNIAAIANKAGNVMAMMPHPERTTAGDPIFQSMRKYIAEGEGTRLKEVTPLYYLPRRGKILNYQKPENTYECIVSLLITDNTAITVQNTLQQLGIPVRVKRAVHWEIKASADAIANIKTSGVLFNDRKEIETQLPNASTNSITFLVREKDDLVGLNAKQTLQDHFGMHDLQSIKHSVLWHFSWDEVSTDIAAKILQTNIIANPYAHDYFYYS